MDAMTATLRVEAQLTDSASVQQVQRLQAVLQAGNTELVRGALQLLDWCVAQVRQGRQIASVTEGDEVVREFSTPLLERARAHDRLMLSAESFDQLATMVERPAAPTDALRALMAAEGTKHS